MLASLSVKACGAQIQLSAVVTRYNVILHQNLYSQQTPRISHLQTSCSVAIVSHLENIDRVITPAHVVFTQRKTD